MALRKERIRIRKCSQMKYAEIHINATIIIQKSLQMLDGHYEAAAVATREINFEALLSRAVRKASTSSGRILRQAAETSR